MNALFVSNDGEGFFDLAWACKKFMIRKGAMHSIYLTCLVHPESLHRINRSRPARRDKSSDCGTNRQQQDCAK